MSSLVCKALTRSLRRRAPFFADPASALAQRTSHCADIISNRNARPQLSHESRNVKLSCRPLRWMSVIIAVRIEWVPNYTSTVAMPPPALVPIARHR